MNSLNLNYAKSWYGDWNDACLDRLFCEESQEKASFSELPIDILNRVWSFLDANARDCLSKVDQQFHAFSLMSKVHLETSLTFNLINFLIENLDIKKYNSIVERFGLFRVDGLEHQIKTRAQFYEKFLEIKEEILSLLKEVEYRDLKRLQELFQNQKKPFFFKDLFRLATFFRLNNEYRDPELAPTLVSSSLPHQRLFLNSPPIFIALYELLQEYDIDQVITKILDANFCGELKNVLCWQLFEHTLAQVGTQLNDDRNFYQILQIARMISDDCPMKNYVFQPIVFALGLGAQYSFPHHDHEIEEEMYCRMDCEKMVEMVTTVYSSSETSETMLRNMVERFRTTGHADKAQELTLAIENVNFSPASSS